MAKGWLKSMENIKQKILLVLTRSPYPANDGTKERILGEIKALSSDFEVNLLIVSAEEITQKQKDYLKNVTKRDVFVFKLSKISCYFHSFLGLFTSYPIQSFYFYRKNVSRWFQKNKDNYDVVHFHTVRFGKYLINLKKEKTKTRFLMYFNDAISLNYKDAGKKAKGLWRLIYSIETNRIKNYELKMLNVADGFSIISQRDKDYLINNWKEKYANKETPEIQVIRNGIDDYLFDYNYNPQTNNLVFIGNLFYPPNRQGLSFFICNIWQNIILKKPEIKLLIIGRGGEEFFKQTENINVLGFVDNPYELMTKQALFISPANFGAGVPTKSLLAMALGLPVVSTTINAKGIEGIIENENIYLIDYNKCDEAANKIIQILEDKDSRIKVGNNGKKLISNNYRQSIIYPKLKYFINCN